MIKKKKLKVNHVIFKISEDSYRNQKQKEAQSPYKSNDEG